MKKAICTFEVTSEKTEVTAIGLNGMPEKLDITGTEEEKDFIALLKKLRELQITKQVLNALDINTWQEG